MKYEKGQSGNPAGRPKGAENRLTREIRETLKAVIEDELERLPTSLQNLPEPERLQVLLKLLPYVLPKVENVHMNEGEPLGSNWGVL